MRTGNFEETEEISEFSRDLNRTFSWFDENFSQITKAAASDFWNECLSCRLVSVSENVNILASSDEYFVTQVRLNKEISVVLRLSKQIVKTLLDETLGMSSKSFNIEKITELEARVLTEFNNFLYKNLEHLFLKGSDLPKNIYTYDECHLTYFLRSDRKTYGKLIISLPTMAITPQILPQRAEPAFTLVDFPDSFTEIDLEVGSTRIKLNDLKQLENYDEIKKSLVSQLMPEYDIPSDVNDYELGSVLSNEEGQKFFAPQEALELFGEKFKELGLSVKQGQELLKNYLER